jgi:hypothetical protein
MAVNAGIYLFEKGVIGQGDAHLKLTVPNNNQLRFLGLGGQLDVVLSAEQDVTTAGQNINRPRYPVQIGGTAIADFDFIALRPDLPFKAYLNLTNLPDYRQASAFSQLGAKLGFEYRLYTISLFAGLEHHLFSLRSGLDTLAIRDAGQNTLTTAFLEQGGFSQNATFASLGLRYRYAPRWWKEGGNIVMRYIKETFKGTSGLAQVRFRMRETSLGLEKLTETGWEELMHTPRWQMKLRLDVPVFFRETNAEAVRAMIYLEKEKTKRVERAKSREQQAASLPGESLGGLAGAKPLDEGKFKEVNIRQYLDQEDEMKKKEEEIQDRRKKISRELKKIEEELDYE